MKRELKTATLNLRTSPAVRDMAERLAAADQRSVTNMVERLIADAFTKLQPFEDQDDAKAFHTTRRPALS